MSKTKSEREANEKKVGIAKRQRHPQDQRSQVDLSQISSSSSSYSVDGDLSSDLNQVSHAASSNPSVSSDQQRLDSAATSVARDAVAKGAAIAIVENASKEAAADDDDDDDDEFPERVVGFPATRSSCGQLYLAICCVLLWTACVSYQV